MRKSRRHLLLLDDSRDVHLAFIALFERVHGYVIHTASSIKEASGLIGRLNVDLAIVDLSYGAELSARLTMIRGWRSHHECFPIIATSAHDYDGLSIEAFSVGADDYVRKPFRFSEMAARIRQHLTRGRHEPSRLPKIDGMRLPSAAFEFAGAVIHPDLRISFPDQTAVQLTAKQVGILQEFVRHSGSLILRNELIHAVWGADANPNSKSIDQYLYVLRRVYRAAGIDLSACITPVLRVGWRIAVNTAETRSAAIQR
jgi:two-component system, OmpR family, copper resistance phosphate regulon response regulator CusR